MWIKNCLMMSNQAQRSMLTGHCGPFSICTEIRYPADAAMTLLRLVLGFLTEMSSAGSFVVVLSLTVRPCVRLCGFVERSVARAHGLLWGWLKAASLFAYQMTCGRENTDLHGRKQTGFDPSHRAEMRAGRDVRLGARCVACFPPPCVCLCVCVWRRAFLKCAWRQTVACKYVPGCLWRHSPLKCVCKCARACSPTHEAKACVEEVGACLWFFIFTSKHERLTPQCECESVCVCMCVCVCVFRMCACADHMPVSLLYTSAGFGRLFFSPLRGDRESVVVTL